MRSRCDRTDHPSYQSYGGRGITYDPRWVKFAAFFADMGKRPEGKTLDRIDNDGPYTKENCRWATLKEQRQNSRDNVWLTFEGETLCASQMAKKYGLHRGTLWDRLRRGWPLEKALTTPVQSR